MLRRVRQSWRESMSELERECESWSGFPQNMLQCSGDRKFLIEGNFLLEEF